MRRSVFDPKPLEAYNRSGVRIRYSSIKEASKGLGACRVTVSRRLADGLTIDSKYGPVRVRPIEEE